MVGGWIIEIIESDIQGETQITCVDRYGDERCVIVETAPAMPLVGDEIWWQSGKVYWDKDRRTLRKIGNAFDPQRVVNKHPPEPGPRISSTPPRDGVE
jgi:hypothetical protein